MPAFNASIAGPNSGAPSAGNFVAQLQAQINELQTQISAIVRQNGAISLAGQIDLRGHDIVDAGQISCDILNYGVLNPPVSSGGNITAPSSSTDNAIARFNGMTGALLQNSNLTLSDDARLAANANVIDLSVSGTINLASANVCANGSPIVASSSRVTADSDIAIFDGPSGLVVKSSGIQASAITGKLPLSGGRLIGLLDMGGNNIVNIGAISGLGVAKNVDSIVVSSVSDVKDSDIVVFDNGSGRIVKNSGIQASTIAMKVSRTGDTMAGTLDMGGNSIRNVSFLSGSSNLVNVNTIVVSATDTVVDSELCVFYGTSGKTVRGAGFPLRCIADKMPLSGGTFTGNVSLDQNVLTVNRIGASSSRSLHWGSGASDALARSIVIGHSSNALRADSIVIGNNSTSGPVENAIVIGSNVTNNTPNSCLIGDSKVTNIRAGSMACDLGTTDIPFQKIYCSSISNGTTALTIGDPGATTTISGIFATTVPYASWYSNTTQRIYFTSGVARLVRLGSVSSGPKCQFTNNEDILKYTGQRPRTFHISYNVTFKSGARGANMTFFNSVNSTRALRDTQARVFATIGKNNAEHYMTMTLSDLVALQFNDTVQLAAKCDALSNSVMFENVSCNIFGLPD